MATISFKGRHFQREMILQCASWHLGWWDLEEIMQERWFPVDHCIIHCWITHYSSLFANAFRKEKRKPRVRLRLDETHIRIKGEWKYYYRAVDRDGNTIDFLLTSKRDRRAELGFLTKVIGHYGKPILININKSDANIAAINQFSHYTGQRIKIHEYKPLNNIGQQDNRLSKRIISPMLGFKNFLCGQRTLSGIELIRMIRKSLMRKQAGGTKYPADILYGMAN